MMLLFFIILYAIYSVWIITYFRKIIQNDLKFTLNDTKNLPSEWRPFIRVDRRNWRMWEIYFGAVFFLPIRVLSFLSLMLVVFTMNEIMLIGVKEN